MLEIRGNSYQEREPSPTNPIEIKHDNYIFGNIDGQSINIPYNSKLERLIDFININGKWYARFEQINKGGKQ